MQIEIRRMILKRKKIFVLHFYEHFNVLSATHISESINYPGSRRSQGKVRIIRATSIKYRMKKINFPWIILFSKVVK